MIWGHMEKKIVWQPKYLNEGHMVVKKEKTRVKFETNAGKIIRVTAFKTSLPKTTKKIRSSSRKPSQSKKK